MRDCSAPQYSLISNPVIAYQHLPIMLTAFGCISPLKQRIIETLTRRFFRAENY